MLKRKNKKISKEAQNYNNINYYRNIVKDLREYFISKGLSTPANKEEITIKYEEWEYIMNILFGGNNENI